VWRYSSDVHSGQAAITADVVQRVSEANLGELDQWTERVLDAGSLDDVLKSGSMQ